MKKLFNFFVPLVMTVFFLSSFTLGQTKPTQSWPTGGVEVWGTSVQLTWYGQAYTDEVELQVSQNSDFSSPLVNTSLAAATYIYTLSPLTAGTTYYWRVRAKVGSSTSDWASTSFFTHSSSSSNYTITASAGTGGTISPVGAVSVANGGSKTFTISANSGYSISDVTVDGSSVGAVSSYSFTNVTANHTIAATFSSSGGGGGTNYTITASAGSNGNISPSGSVSVTSGGNKLFTMTPNTGYVVDNVLVDNVSVGSVASYTFTNVTASHSISVTFKEGNVIYVDSTGSDLTGDGTLAKPYKTIQKGIDQASTGYTVSVANGTYVENLTISKAITLQGTGYSGTSTIKPSSNSSNTIDVTFNGTSSSQLVIDGFNIDAPSSASKYPVNINASSNYITIRNCKISTYDESATHTGIYFADGSHKNITLGGTSSAQGNVFLFYENDVAVNFDLGVATTPSLYISVLNNTFTASSTGHQAMKFGAVQVLTMTGNTFGSIVTFNVTNNASTQLNIGSDGSGLGNTFAPTNSSTYATGGIKFADVGTGNLSNVNITQNSFLNNTTAINVDVDPAYIDEATFSVTKNNFSGNTTAIKTNSKAYSPSLSALNNYWNSSNGPTNSNNTFNSTHGQTVGANVDFTPFYRSISGLPGTYNGTPFSPVTNNESTPEYYSSLTTAITGTSTGKVLTVVAGTFTEDLTINKALEFSGAGSGSTTIKGVTEAGPNITVSVANVKLHGFKFETPDISDASNEFLKISNGNNLQIYNNNFNAIASTNSGIGVHSCTFIKAFGGGIDLSDLYIYNNTFTFENLIPIGTGTYSYVGIYLDGTNSSGDSTKIYSNTFSGNVYGGIYLDKLATEVTRVYNNTISSSVDGFWGIQVLDPASKIEVANNTISGFKGSGGGYGIQVTSTESDISLTGNTLHDNNNGIFLDPTYTGAIGITYITINGSNDIYSNDVGIKVDAVFVAAQAQFDVIKINSNSIYNNTTSGLDIDGITNPGGSGYTEFDATGNWWGDTDGPYDQIGSAEITSSSPATPVSTIKNEKTDVGSPGTYADGSLGNPVIDEKSSTISMYIDYQGWFSSPKIEVTDVSTVTGATATVPVMLKMFNNDGFNTLEGTISYTNSKLDLQSATYGTGTLINSNGWTITFLDDSANGKIQFAAVGANKITTDGTLFNLLMKVIDPIASGSSSSDITGVKTDFKADGNSSYFDEFINGTVSYDFISTTYKRGDVDLDTDIDINDATAISNYLSGSISLSALAIQDADADLSGGGTTATASDITTGDISAILYYLLNSEWPPAPTSASGVVAFSNVMVSPDNLLHLPVSINASSNVYGLEMEFNYDPAVINYQTFKNSMVVSGNIVDVIKVKEGKAKLVFASANGQNGNINPGEVILNFPTGIPAYSTISTRYSLNGGEFVEGPKYKIGSITGIEDNNAIPTDFEISQNYPNPFNPTTTIKFALPQASFVTLKIYNMLGQEVKTLVNEQKSAGTFNVQWKGDNNFGQKVASGTYIYRIIAGQNVFAKKMILLK